MSEKNKIVWQADSSHPELAEGLRQTLRQIVDPEIGLNIIELGLVRDVEIADDSAKITMILTTPFCPYGPAMLEMTRQKIEEFYWPPQPPIENWGMRCGISQ